VSLQAITFNGTDNSKQTKNTYKKNKKINKLVPGKKNTHKTLN